LSKIPRETPQTEQPPQVARNAEETRHLAGEILGAKPPLKLKIQEPPFDHPDSCNFFRLDGSKPVVATPAALHDFTQGEIPFALELLQREAILHNGLDYLQVFEDDRGRRLWVIEDPQVITVLLPEDY